MERVRQEETSGATVIGGLKPKFPEVYILASFSWSSLTEVFGETYRIPNP